MKKGTQKTDTKRIKKIIGIWFIALTISLFSSPRDFFAQTPYFPYSPYSTPRPPIDVFCNNGINTAIGCIPTDNINGFLAFILRWALGVAGGIAFLLVVYSGFTILTSTGNPQKMQAGKELLTAALAGIILLIFSLFLLDII